MKVPGIENKKHLAIVGVLLAVLLTQNVIVASSHSFAWDEIYYMGEGVRLLRSNLDQNPCLINPPLTYYINSLFLFQFDAPQEVYDIDNCPEFTDAFVFNSGHDHRLITLLARLPFAFISMLVAVYVFVASFQLFGRKSAFVALLLYVFSVSVLNYSTFATLDFSVAAFVFIATYHFWRYLQTKTKLQLIFTGVFAAFAVTSKITGGFLPLIFFVLLVAHLVKDKNDVKSFLKKLILPLLSIAVVMFVVIWAIYGFSVGTVEGTLNPHYADRAQEEFQKTFTNPAVYNTATFLFEKMPIPFPELFFSLGYLTYYQSEGRGNFFIEPVINMPWHVPYSGFFLKVQTAFTILVIVSFFTLPYLKARWKDQSLLFLLFPVAVILLFFTFNHFVAGISHILWVMPFLFVWVSGLWQVQLKNKDMHKFFSVSLWALLGLYFVSFAFIFPHPVSYFTELIGGGSQGYKYMVSGNLDTGQALPSLKKYLDEHNIDSIPLSFSGSVDPTYYGIEYEYLPSIHFNVWDPHYKSYTGAKDFDVVDDCSRRTGLLAISVSNLQGVALLNKTCYSWLHEYDPIAKIENAIFVYDIPS